MLPEDRVRLRHMIEAAETACDFVAGKVRSDLETDRVLLFAVVRAIEIVGEAGSRVSAATREAAAEIPWAHIVSTRNRLIHAYFEVDKEVVWKTVTEELPHLLPKLSALVEGDGDE